MLDRRSLLCCAAGLAWASPRPGWARHGPKQKVDGAIAGWRVVGFTLTDQQGQAFTEQALNEHWSFLLFGSTARCADGCTQAMGALAGMWRRLERTQKLADTQLVFVSLDAETDTPQRLQGFLAGYDVPFIGCVGSAAMLRRLTDDLGVPVDTRGSLWLLGPDRAVRGEFKAPFDMKLLTSAYLKLRLRG